MNLLRWWIFRFLFWLLHRRKTRKKLALIVRDMDNRRNPEWQPLKGKDKFNSALVLTMDYFGRRKKPPPQQKIVRSMEWAVQRQKGRKFVSSRQNDGKLARLYTKKRRSETDKTWGIDTKNEERIATHVVLAVEKEKQRRKLQGKKK